MARKGDAGQGRGSEARKCSSRLQSGGSVCRDFHYMSQNWGAPLQEILKRGRKGLYGRQGKGHGGNPISPEPGQGTVERPLRISGICVPHRLIVVA